MKKEQNLLKQFKKLQDKGEVWWSLYTLHRNVAIIVPQFRNRHNATDFKSLILCSFFRTVHVIYMIYIQTKASDNTLYFPLFLRLSRTKKPRRSRPMKIRLMRSSWRLWGKNRIKCWGWFLVLWAYLYRPAYSPKNVSFNPRYFTSVRNPLIKWSDTTMRGRRSCLAKSWPSPLPLVRVARIASSSFRFAGCFCSISWFGSTFRKTTIHLFSYSASWVFFF